MTSNHFFNFHPNRWRPDADSKASAANREWHAPRPRARAVVVEPALVPTSFATVAAVPAFPEQSPQRAAGAWGTRRPPGGRARRALLRGRRPSQRLRPRGPAPDPNLTCRAFVDYFGDGQYALMILEEGCEPEVAILMAHPGKVLDRASRFLQPGLIASVSEAALLAIKLDEPTWNINGPGQDGSKAGSPSLDSPGPGPFGSAPPWSRSTSLTRPGTAGDGLVMISHEWLVAVFGPPLSKRGWLRLRFEIRGQRGRQSQDAMQQTPEVAPELARGPAPGAAPVPAPGPAPEPAPESAPERPPDSASEPDRKPEG